MKQIDSEPLQTAPATAGWRLVTLGTLMRRALDRTLQPLGTSADQVQALDLLAGAPRTVGELGQAMGLERNSASQLVERLVQRRLVQRVRSRTDRRQVDVAIAPAGQTLLATAKPRVLALSGALAATVSPEDLATATRLLDSAIHLLQLQQSQHEAAEESAVVTQTRTHLATVG